LVVFFIMFLEGGNDIIAVLLDVSVESITRILQVAIVLAPILLWVATFLICRQLKTTRLHPAAASAGLRLRRTAGGGYETVSLEPTSPE
jgi:ubiquinol-cytochrome c reductase cytochrome b subunit